MALTRTPYDVLAGACPARRVTKPEVFAVCRRLEDLAVADPPANALAVVQDVRFASPSARGSWRQLAAAGATVSVYGRDLPAYLCEGVPGVDLEDDDPLVDVWAFLVTWHDGRAAGFAAADVVPGAVDRDVPDATRTFDLVETTDPALVAEAVTSLRVISTS